MAAEIEFVGLAEALRKSLEPHLEKLMSGTSFAMDFSFPISKVDPSTRTVEGVATDESIDSHGEILDYQASKQAFAGWQKNIREMHSNIACGRAVSIQCDDAAKSISIKARISRGAEDTWQKCLDGTLRCFSVGGTRLRSEIRSDGIRRTSEYRLGEVSLVDVGANPSTSFKIVKSLSGKTTATEIIALDVEGDYLALADAVDAVARQLVAKCRPLAQEVSKALLLAGSDLICNQLAPDDFSHRGKQIASDLVACATVLRGAGALEDLEKAREAAAFVLRALVSRKDLTRLRKKGNAEDRGITLQGLQGEIAKCLGQLRGLEGSGAEETIEKLETNVMQLQGIAHAVGGLGKSLFTAQELTEMRDKLAVALNDWHVARKPQNVPEYRRLSDTYFLVAQQLKNFK
jgi:hypothetical protein